MTQTISTQGDPRRKADNGRLILLASSLAILFTSFTTAGLNVAIPDIGNEFHADAVLLGWVVNSFFLLLSVSLVPFGRISDMVGLKKIFIWGIILFTLISAVTVFSGSTVMLIICRALQGISCAMIFSTGTALVTASHDIATRGRALGISTSSVYVGYSAGPFLGGILTEAFGWRSMFAIVIPVGILVISLMLWKVKGDWSPSRGEKFDTRGSIVYGISLIAMIYGFSRLPEISGIALSLIGIMGTLAFLKLEAGTVSPVLNTGVFRNNKPYLFSNLATLISYSANSAIIYLMSLYLQYIKALTAEQAGLILLSMPIMLVIGCPISGRLSDKIEPRIVASLGMTLVFFGLVLLAMLDARSSVGYIIASLLVTGLGMAVFIPPNNNAVMSSITSKHYGIASATLGTMRSIGQMFSISIATVAISIVIGEVVITPVYYPGFIVSLKIAFAIFSALCFAGIIVSLIRGRVRNP